MHLLNAADVTLERGGLPLGPGKGGPSHFHYEACALEFPLPVGPGTVAWQQACSGSILETGFIISFFSEHLNSIKFFVEDKGADCCQCSPFFLVPMVQTALSL